MNIWTDKVDMDSMTPHEWRDYRDNLVCEYYDRGFILKPNINCPVCDPRDDYVCLDCEIQQIDEERGV